MYPVLDVGLSIIGHASSVRQAKNILRKTGFAFAAEDLALRWTPSEHLRLGADEASRAYSCDLNFPLATPPQSLLRPAKRPLRRPKRVECIAAARYARNWSA